MTICWGKRDVSRGGVGEGEEVGRWTGRREKKKERRRIFHAQRVPSKARRAYKDCEEH